MISRRHFLRIGARSAAIIAGGAGLMHLSRMSALAQTTAGYRALVCVFLHGGNDGNNMIVPMSSGYQAYTRARRGLALPESSLLPLSTGTGDAYGLHGRLAGLQRLFSQRRLAVVANVGVLVRPISREEYLARSAPLPRNLFSHMDQQLAWQTATAGGDATAGWGGRIADRLADSSGSAFPSVVSVAGNAVFATGARAMPATIIPGIPPGLAVPDVSNGSAARVGALQQMLTLSGGAVLVQATNDRTKEGLRQAERLNAVAAAQRTLSTPFPQTDLGEQLFEIARVIQGRNELGASRQIFFCSANGFDTHASQLTLQDNAFAELGPALAAFSDAMQELGVDQQVTTFTESEFGRTLRPTSGTGSDHGWGSHHLVMGGAVRGGTIYGQLPTLALGGPDDVGSSGIWLPTLSLDQYGATLASWFGVAPTDLSAIFPNLGRFPSANIGFMGS